MNLARDRMGPVAKFRPPATLAVKTLAYLPRMKTLFAAFQQTTPRTRPPSQTPRPTFLISGMSKALGRAHGR
jgi:hypothetical protein